MADFSAPTGGVLCVRSPRSSTTPTRRDCGRCAVCTSARWDGELDGELKRAALLHLRSQPLDIDVKKMAPDASGSMRKIPEGVLPQPGRALGRLGDAGWDPLVEAGTRAGRFSDELVDGAVELIRRWGPPIRWVTVVPSAR